MILFSEDFLHLADFLLDLSLGPKLFRAGMHPVPKDSNRKRPNRSSILHLSEAGAAMEDGAESNPDAEGNPFGGRKMARNYR